MPSLTQSLARLLDGVQRPGDFSAGGLCDMLAPSLEVEGVGPIALPLLPMQAEQIIAVAKRAPFGRGAQTLVDTTVRRTWQIGPDQVRISGQGWARTLEEIVRRVAEGLGVTDTVEAAFYKLLLYDAGGFFVGHRDTEKAPGMFATLVVVLPSTSTGGELVVGHEGREARYDLRGSDASQAAFAGFYADCLHEVLPVTSGCRLTLVYNLLRREAAEAPKPPDYGTERARLAALLGRWSEDDEAPLKIVHPLEHAYTPAGLAFAALKGADAAKASTLRAAAEEADCDLHLALLSIEESGMADHTGGYGYRSRRWRDDEDEDEFEIVEVQDRTETLAEWHRPDGAPTDLGPLPTEAEEMSPPDALDGMTPDDQSFSEATGNEGASFERSYSRAALVLWPRRDRLAVVNQGGLPATLPLLAGLADRWAAGGAAASVRDEAHALAGHMIETWPAGRRNASQMLTEVGTMLEALRRLGDVERIEGFLEEVTAQDRYGKGQAEHALPALSLLARDRVAPLCAEIVAGNAPTGFASAADFLAAATAAAAAGRLDLAPDELLPAARALLAAMPADPARVSGEPYWGRPPKVEPAVLADALKALAWIDRDTADEAASLVLAWPAVYGFDDVLVPALLAIGPDSGAAAESLRVAALRHLGERIALPLAPPSDWARDGTLTCQCSRCAELSRFLVDPKLQTWTLRAVEHDRGHVESTIQSSGCDLDCTTLRKGRPYTLVCTKTQASYERRARERERDLANVARLTEATAPRDLGG